MGEIIRNTQFIDWLGEQRPFYGNFVGATPDSPLPSPTPTITPTNTGTPNSTPTQTPTPTQLYSTEYQNILNYAQGQGYTVPSDGQKTLQNQLILDLISNNVWNFLDFLYITATDGDEDYAKINWINPGSYTLVDSGSPTFTTNSGFTGDGLGAYLDTNFNPTTVLGTRVRNSMGAWVDLTGGDARCVMGSFVTRRQHILPKFVAVGGGAFFGIDTTSTENPTAGVLSQTSGLWETVNLSSINQIKLYVNGVDQISPGLTYTSGTMDNGDIFLLARNTSGSPNLYSDATLKAAYLGTEDVYLNDIYTPLDNYINSI